MRQIEVQINHRAYSVACDSGEEDRVRELAQFVDKLMRPLANVNASDAQLLALTSLMLADEVLTSRASQANKPKIDESILLQALESLTGRVEGLAKRFGNAYTACQEGDLPGA